MTDQRDEWRKAVAAHNKAKRNQRHRRKPPQYQPGMNVTKPARDERNRTSQDRTPADDKPPE